MHTACEPTRWSTHQPCMNTDTAQQVGAVVQRLACKQLASNHPASHTLALLAIASCHAPLQADKVLEHSRLPKWMPMAHTRSQLAKLAALRVLCHNVCRQRGLPTSTLSVQARSASKPALIASHRPVLPRMSNSTRRAWVDSQVVAARRGEVFGVLDAVLDDHPDLTECTLWMLPVVCAIHRCLCSGDHQGLDRAGRQAPRHRVRWGSSHCCVHAQQLTMQAAAGVGAGLVPRAALPVATGCL